MKGDHRIHFDTDWKYAQYLDGETVVNLPCRKCIGCNMGTQRDWAVRGFHEAQLHTAEWTEPATRITTALPNNSVITLTYNDEHLPAGGVLDHEDFQKFMKRLRIRAKRRGFKKAIRYFMCGEYGGQTSRPHYHAVIFNESFEHRYQITQGQKAQSCSYELDELWSQPVAKGEPPTKIGTATVDDFSFAGASYVSGYIAKKVLNGHDGPIQHTRDAHGVDRWTPIQPEYRQMSRHPGLGAEWILEPDNMQRVYSADCVKISTWTFHPPKYYDVLLDRVRPDLTRGIIEQRRKGMSQAAEDWSPERCSSAEQIALSDLQLRRDSL